MFILTTALCPISKIVTPSPHFNVENIAGLVNKPGNHNFDTERGVRGAKTFVSFIGHDIIALMVAPLSQHVVPNPSIKECALCLTNLLRT